jgi:hypothetical protein
VRLRWDELNSTERNEFANLTINLISDVFVGLHEVWALKSQTATLFEVCHLPFVCFLFPSLSETLHRDWSHRGATLAGRAARHNDGGVWQWWWWCRVGGVAITGDRRSGEGGGGLVCLGGPFFS